jgi:hypothetical protein
MMMTRARPYIALATLCLLAAACGNGDDAADDAAFDDLLSDDIAAETAEVDPEVQLVEVVLREWQIELGEDAIDAGPVTFAITNHGEREHVIEIVRGDAAAGAATADDADGGWRTTPIEPGGSIHLGVNLAAGEYRIVSPLAEGEETYEQRGMIARLRVR